MLHIFLQEHPKFYRFNDFGQLIVNQPRDSYFCQFPVDTNIQAITFQPG